jgi:hypothetical protein
LPVTDVITPVVCTDTDIALPGAEFQFTSALHGIQNNRGPPHSVIAGQTASRA